MKKVLLVLSVALLSLTSCSKEEAVSDTLLEKVKSIQFVKDLDVANKNAYLKWNNNNLEIIERWRYSNPDVCWYKYNYIGVAKVISNSENEFEIAQPVKLERPTQDEWEGTPLMHRVKGYYAVSGELVISHYVSYYLEGDEWLSEFRINWYEDEEKYYEYELSLYEENHECIIIRD